MIILSHSALTNFIKKSNASFLFSIRSNALFPYFEILKYGFPVFVK